MNIAINAFSAQTGGGVSVLTNLLPYLARSDSKNKYVIFYSPAQRGFIGAIPEQFKKIPVRYVPRNPYARVLWEQFVFPFYLLRHRIAVLYSVGNTTSIFAPCKVVLLMENANPYSLIHLPWSFKNCSRFALLQILGWLSARRATKIRFVSKNSHDLIVPRLRVSTKKCVVIPHGIPTLFSAISTVPGASSYILTIGTNGPHRNTVRLLKAFSILVNQYGYQGDLIIVGNTGSAQHRQLLDTIVKKLELSQRISFEGEVPHDAIASYYRHATTFVFPSIEETFGLPLLEAMAMGVPIVAADCDRDAKYRGKCFNPFREICGDAAVYCNPFNPDDMASVLHRMLTDGVLREKLVAEGKERVKKYTFEHTTKALVHLFDTVGSPPLR